MASKIGRLRINKSVLLLCDMQEKFAKVTSHFNEITQTSSRLLDVANLIDMPSVATEQYPKGSLCAPPPLFPNFYIAFKNLNLKIIPNRSWSYDSTAQRQIQKYKNIRENYVQHVH